MPGTIGRDVMTVHKMRDGLARCGASAADDSEGWNVWQREVNCPPCRIT